MITIFIPRKPQAYRAKPTKAEREGLPLSTINLTIANSSYRRLRFDPTRLPRFRVTHFVTITIVSYGGVIARSILDSIFSRWVIRNYSENIKRSLAFYRLCKNSHHRARICSTDNAFVYSLSYKKKKKTSFLYHSTIN